MHVNFNLWSLGMSGGTRTVFQLANGLAAKGHTVTLTALGKGGLPNWFGTINATLNVVQPSRVQRVLRKYLLPPFDLDWAHALADAIPDCDVNVATYFETAFPTYLSGRGRGFYFVQNWEPWFFPSDSQEARRAEASYLLPLKKLTVSKWLRKDLSWTVVGNGVDLSVFKPYANKQHEGNRVMVFTRGISWKNERPAIRAVNLLNGKHPITPSGRLRDDELAALYSSCDALLFPSKFEGFGLPPLEAMACGTPVVVTPCQGISEYARHMGNCYVATSDDSQVLSDAVKTVLSDEKLQKQLVKGGLKTAREHDFKNVVNKFERCIRGA